MFGVFRLKSGFFLSIDHKIICEFMIDIVEVNMGQVVFRTFFIELIQRILFTRNS